MHPHVIGRRQLRPLSRQFERSHLEPQLIASAYECACPIVRRTWTFPNRTPATPQPCRLGAAAAAATGG